MTTTFTDAGEARFTFTTAGTSSELRVTTFTGFEALSELFRFSIELASPDDQIDLDAIVGSPAQLDLIYEDGIRSVFGIVSQFEQSVSGETFTPYFAELVPTVWMLTQQYASRIFQDKSTPEIIEQVLSDAGVGSDYFRFALQGSFDPRVYCVQYRETHWNFIARLMEEEGIFFFFEHADGKDVLVMANSADAHVAIPGTADVVFRDASGTVEEDEYIYTFRFSQRIRPGKISLKDFNFETPSLGLLNDTSAQRNPELEIYEYPGLYGTDSAGSGLATVRLEAAQAQRLLGQGDSVCRRLIPGYNFTLGDFPRDDLNQQYLVIAVQHEGVQPLGQDDAGGHYKYDNHFRCIPSSVTFRPIRKTPKPVVEGTQTAFVTGPSGEEVFVDEYGRVKVQFHWDREGQNDEHSSCWIRVSQLWAGAGWGAMFIPRIGHEVIVDFIEGDPDRPIITGRVYHAENVVPYALDAEKTKSTIKSESSLGGGGFNEYRFEDKSGSEEIYQHAQKDLTIKTENDKNQDTGHDETLHIGNDRTKTVDNDETSTIHGNRTETVDKDETITIHGQRTETVDKDETITIHGQRTETVDKDETITVHGNRTETVDKDETVSVSGNRTLTVSKDDTQSIGKNSTVSIGDAGKTDVGKDCVLTVGKKYTVSAKDVVSISSDKEIKLSCGKATIVMKKDGTITINGKDIAIKGSGKINAKASKNIVMKGKKILQN